MAALLAGQYPERVMDQEGLSSSVVEELQSAGIRTVAFTEGGFVSNYFGFDRGFDDWTEEEGAVQLLHPGQQRDPTKPGGVERTFARAERWLADNAADRFFLLVHTYEPHTPYTNRDFAQGLQPGRIGPAFTLDDLTSVQSGQLALTPAELDYLTALYDGDILNSDRHVGALLDKLDDLDLATRVAVIVTSDHGEELGEHFPSNAGDHGHSLRDTEVMVPLIIRDPGGGLSGRTVGQQIRLLDVMPTAADPFRHDR
jgi:arylsulfatase A-like enzyme